MELKEPLDKENYPNTHFSDHLDVLKHLSKVHHGLKNEISDDYVLAKLDEEQRTFIIEQVRNAIMYKSMIENIANEVHKRREQTKIINKELGIEEREIEKKAWEQEEESIRKIAKETYDIMLSQTHMITTLHRNVLGNTLLELMGRPQEVSRMIEPEEKEGILSKILKKEEKKEGEK